MGIYIAQKTAGLYKANQHVSVMQHAGPRYVYEVIAKAVRNDPFRSVEQKDIDRMLALEKAFDRVQRVSDRVRENFQVSRGDHVRMKKEFEYLRNRIQLLVSDKLYEEPIDLSTNDIFVGENEGKVHLKQRVNQLLNATWAGEYRQTRDSQLSIIQAARAARLGRFDFDRLAHGLPDTPENGPTNDDLALSFSGPVNLYSKRIKVDHTTLDFRDDLARIPNLDEDNDPDQLVWVKRAAEITRQRIIDNPARALAALVDGYEKSGRILLQL